jgi:hypothetical protein
MPLVQCVIQAYRAGFNPEWHRPPEYLLMVEEPGSLPEGAIWGRAPKVIINIPFEEGAGNASRSASPYSALGGPY